MHGTLGAFGSRLTFACSAIAGIAGQAIAQASWQPIHELTTRTDSATAYDAARGVTVLYGGYDSTPRDDMWQWDGTAWTELHPAHRPGTRMSSSMVYDRARQRVLLFGGDTGFGATNDLWSWDGNDWSSITTAHSPQAYNAKGLVYDSARDRVVLFGSTSAGAYGGTWEFDGTDWTQAPFVLPNWPITSDNLMLAYDEVAGNTAYFYWYGSTQVMWRWNGTAWTAQNGTGFPNVNRARLIFDPVRARLLLVSGWPQGITPPATMHAWNPASANWLTLASDGPIGAHATCYDSARDRIVVVGGTAWGTPADSSVWEWDGTAWLRRTYAPPKIREQSLLVHDIAHDRLILYGRRSEADTWVRSQGNWQLVVPAPISYTTTHPGTINGIQLVHDEARDQTLLLAGDSGFAFWRLAGNQWLPITAGTPSSRQNPGVVYDRARQRVVLFGGASGTTKRNDLWTWNGTAWTQLFPVHSPHPRDNPGIAYDPLRDRIVVLGGGQESGLPTDTWEYDGTDWSLESTAAVTPPQSPVLAYDEVRQTTVALLQQFSGPLQTWQWDGVLWTQVSQTAVPPTRAGASLVSTANELLLFGGRGSQSQPIDGSMWLLSTPTVARATPFGPSGTSSAGPLDLHVAGAGPWIGSRCQLAFGPLPGLPLPGLWVGLSRTSWQGQTLPTDLGFVGYPGSQLLIALDGPLATLNNGLGLATAAIDLPPAPSLVGVELFFQAFVYEPLTASLTTSNGLAFTLGAR
jgi:hypothetical protein